jgi:hypothetical protein
MFVRSNDIIIFINLKSLFLSYMLTLRMCYNYALSAYRIDLVSVSGKFIRDCYCLVHVGADARSIYFFYILHKKLL